MGKRPKTKMTMEDRAKQFMPFAAVRGLEKAIAEVENRREQEKGVVYNEKIDEDIAED